MLPGHNHASFVVSRWTTLLLSGPKIGSWRETIWEPQQNKVNDTGHTTYCPAESWLQQAQVTISDPHVHISMGDLFLDTYTPPADTDTHGNESGYNPQGFQLQPLEGDLGRCSEDRAEGKVMGFPWPQRHDWEPLLVHACNSWWHLKSLLKIGKTPGPNPHAFQGLWKPQTQPEIAGANWMWLPVMSTRSSEDLGILAWPPEGLTHLHIGPCGTATLPSPMDSLPTNFPLHGMDVKPIPHKY